MEKKIEQWDEERVKVEEVMVEEEGMVVEEVRVEEEGMYKRGGRRWRKEWFNGMRKE